MINNITIATADDITTLSDDVNIYPIDLSGTINTLSNALNWLEKKQLFQTSIFFNLFSVILGTHPWPLSVGRGLMLCFWLGRPLVQLVGFYTSACTDIVCRISQEFSSLFHHSD